MNGNFFTIKEVSEWMLMIGLLSYVSDFFVRLLRPIRSCFCINVEINSIFGARVQPDCPCPAYRRYKVTHQIPELWNTSILIMVM